MGADYTKIPSIGVRFYLAACVSLQQKEFGIGLQLIFASVQNFVFIPHARRKHQPYSASNKTKAADMRVITRATFGMGAKTPATIKARAIVSRMTRPVVPMFGLKFISLIRCGFDLAHHTSFAGLPAAMLQFCSVLFDMQELLVRQQ